jgi:predicted DCC family thiol-disulfide oxidoreductase YuxK
MNSPARTVLFDGVCNLCNGAVRFIVRRDPAGRFRFAPLQSEAGRAALREAGAPAGELESIVLIEAGHAHFRSAAALRIARGLRFPWPLLALGLAIPPFLRDPLYDFIARRRYRWFGRRESCELPSPALKDRFLG